MNAVRKMYEDLPPLMHAHETEEPRAAYKSQPFLKLMRSPAIEELLQHPNELAVLTLVAYRARRSGENSLNGLQQGEAMVGDYGAVGMTRQQFRTALANLLKWKYLTTKTTNRGTIATLCDSSIYDINSESSNHQPNHQTTSQQPPNNQPATTNKKERKKEVKKDSSHTSADAEESEFSKFNKRLKDCKSEEDILAYWNSIPKEQRPVRGTKEHELFANRKLELATTFDIFWEAYQHKKGSKPNAKKLWDKIEVAARQRILAGLPTYIASIDEKRYQPHATTFLNGKYYAAESYGVVEKPEPKSTPNPLAIPQSPDGITFEVKPEVQAIHDRKVQERLERLAADARAKLEAEQKTA